MNKKNKKAIVVYFIFIFCGTLSLAYNSKHAFADETKVILETQDIHLVYSGLVLLGDLTITALAEDTITGPCDVLLKIPENKLSLFLFLTINSEKRSSKATLLM